MANSQYEHVKEFEQHTKLLKNTWIVVRIDGRAFSRFTAKHGFEKPNDRRGIDLMNAAATAVMEELRDICCAYGVSDEYSFVFKRSTELFERREIKLVTTVVSSFTAWYLYLWSKHFPDQALVPPLPTFDGRAVCYPDRQNVRDYLSWRQVDCHINNLYNTTFWALVQKEGRTKTQATKDLDGTLSGDKNEILFSRFDINYNNEPEIFKKGNFLYREYYTNKSNSKAEITLAHTDIIKDDFWKERQYILM